MRVDFFRTGGDSDMRLTTSLDTTRQFPDEAVKVHKLLDDAGFFDLPSQIGSPNDEGFQYQITVDSAEHTHTVKVSDAACPTELRPLIDYLSNQATETRK